MTRYRYEVAAGAAVAGRTRTLSRAIALADRAARKFGIWMDVIDHEERRVVYKARRKNVA